MGKWIVLLIACLAAGCGSREVRCDGHLVAINPPLTSETRQAVVPGELR